MSNVYSTHTRLLAPLKAATKKYENCAICTQKMSYTREPAALHCGHIFCRPCLEQHSSNASQKCPMCCKDYYSIYILRDGEVERRDAWRSSGEKRGGRVLGTGKYVDDYRDYEDEDDEDEDDEDEDDKDDESDGDWCEYYGHEKSCNVHVSASVPLASLKGPARRGGLEDKNDRLGNEEGLDWKTGMCR